MAEQYAERLRDLPALQLPVERPWARSVYWMYGVVLAEESGMDAEELSGRLRERGVETRPFFLGMHEQPALHRLGLFAGESYPVAERIARQGLYLPSGLTLTDGADRPGRGRRSRRSCCERPVRLGVRGGVRRALRGQGLRERVRPAPRRSGQGRRSRRQSHPRPRLRHRLARTRARQARARRRRGRPLGRDDRDRRDRKPPSSRPTGGPSSSPATSARSASTGRSTRC